MITRQSLSLALGSMLVATACGGGGGGSSNGGGTTTSMPGNVAALTDDGRIIMFDVDAPETIKSSKTITGLVDSEPIRAIDVRASTGGLYGASLSRLYRIDAATGAATPIGTANLPLIGDLAMQMDPTGDNARVITPIGLNVGIDPQSGVQVAAGNGAHYAPGDVAAGSAPQIGALAFTDDHPFAEHTNLFGIDTMQGSLVRIGDVDGAPSSFANGEVHTIAPVPSTTGSVVGFDITPDGGALMAVTAAGSSQSDLFTVDLSSGAVHSLGHIGDTTVRAIAWRGMPVRRVFGITDQNTLVTFLPGAPGTMQSSMGVSGILPGEHLVAIDQRAIDGGLYAVSDGAHLYLIDTSSGEATALGAGFSVALFGTGFDLDFTPEFGAARVVDDSDQNLRVNPLDGSVGSVDHPLEYGAGDASFGFDPGIVAAAFDKNEFGAGGSTMYAIDATSDMLVRIGSPGGAPDLPSTGVVSTIGPLGVPVGPRCGLDIDADGVAFAALDLGAVSNLCTIDLATGAVRDIGAIGGASRVIDIAVELPRTPTVYGVDDTNTLVTFLAGDPRALQSSQAISGTDPGESIIAIDFRPLSGELLGTSDQNRVFRIDRTTGIATPLGLAFTPAPLGTRTAADVDPKTDELRVVSDGDSNLRVSTTSGDTIGVDTNLAYAAGDVNFGNDPGVASIGHTMSFTGATSTALYGIDATADVLVRQGAFAGPSNGQLRTVGPLGVDLSGAVGFDLDSRGVALVSRSVGTHTLFRVNLTTGALFPLGVIGGAALRDIAILPR